MKNILQRSRLLFENNKKVIENYFFMTVLQVLSSLFYLLIYPYLIRTLGAESYGLYVFVMAIISYFVTFVNYGFDLPAVKAIAQNSTDVENKAHTLSCIFTAKVYLELIATIVFIITVAAIPSLRENWIIYFVCYLQTLTGIFFPQWYFQGVQRMRTVTYIQLFFKVLSLPFIFLLIHNPDDLLLFVIITTLVNIGGAITTAFIVRFSENIKIRWVSFLEIRYWYKEASPFFLSSSASIIKDQSIAIIIGAFFGMKDVAIYDLANKIIILPRILMVNINGALFPKVMANIQIENIKKIIRFETFAGLLVIILVAIFGKWIVILMGGDKMFESYPISIILSITVMVWLVVGAYISFVFIPNNKYIYVTNNQIVALLSFVLYCFLGFLIAKDIYVLVISIAMSGLTEIVYCKYLIRKNNWLKN